MREAGRITARALKAGAAAVRPGVSTAQVDDAVRETILAAGATPSFVGEIHPVHPERAFRHASCISLNSEVVHGVPSPDRIIQEGDIVKLDVGARLNGWHGDSALTVAVGEVSRRAQQLIATTKEALDTALELARPGSSLSKIAHAIEACAQSMAFGVVQGVCGHGIGKLLHERPFVPNYFEPWMNDHDIPLVPGLVIAIEPMFCEGTGKARELADGWTIKVVGSGLTAHFEHTVAVTKDGPLLLTVE